MEEALQAADALLSSDGFANHNLILETQVAARLVDTTQTGLKKAARVHSEGDD